MNLQRFASNFKETYWAEKVQLELEKALVVSNWCDYEYDGEIKFKERVKIIGAVRPQITDYVKGEPIDFEELADNAQYLDINHAAKFGFIVYDIDKAQSNPKYLNTEMTESAKGLAEKEDADVAEVAAKECLNSMKSSSTDISAATDPFEIIDNGIQKLYEQNVPANEKLAADLTPEHIKLCKKSLAKLFTENVDYIKNSAVGMYNNTYLRMSNNLYNDGTDTNELLRTKKAVAVAHSIEKVKKSDMENDFGTKIKGLNVYGIKVIRPKELYVMRVH